MLVVRFYYLNQFHSVPKYDLKNATYDFKLRAWQIRFRFLQFDN